MMGHLGKIALVIGLSHAYRLAGRALGPRWAGLIVALPGSTAVTLVGGGAEHGSNHALQMAEACWTGLAAASWLPLAFAAATIAGRGRCQATAAAVLAYPVALMGVGLLAHLWGEPVAPSLAALAAATVVARRLGEPEAARRWERPAPSRRHVWAIRTAIPVTCLATILALGERLGPEWAGVLGTFPSVTLTALILCHVEAGPVAAVRMARALPPGQWAMVAFLATFHGAVPALGLLAGAGLGYLAALASLLAIARSAQPPVALSWLGQLRYRRADSEPALPTWPRLPRRFSPRFEGALA